MHPVKQHHDTLSCSQIQCNVHDASPQVLAVAMCMDAPVLVNWVVEVYLKPFAAVKANSDKG